MSKFFYRGKPDIMGKNNQGTYQPKPKVKPGSEENPLVLQVQSAARELEINAILIANDLFADIRVDSTLAEDITPLDIVLNKPVTQVFEKTPQRNDPCSCGSNKKYKKCCG
ncbi:SEC-C domain-containing protein [Pseudoalteromonas sp. SR44-5]|uniref:Zinc chelation protein SecC n=2 Tax=Pseudoalteromonas TaxID=53246 RepID=A0ABY3FE36_9GAMM|nr:MULTISPECIES: PBPRA1643 family SWIM/SEC-C metal-binding motif protein [Pseudoalteromonas]MBB1294779.1 SEC-C domain-containing protein [Pseudoalteromonas sp. SR41-4]MBB1302239.1 SEC-C domain-containing protein [Pseudoalteromonas sp. SR44-8]MBB1309992.1 SEC-C domain-containing protein [Pseudoalteromonas sp. SR41-8]MBB1333045.1 SEC-C domain-containing protein [Pseudoalteromonas sp. SR41-6]MBB1340581.1 SEC-C domain-containing protein [Pseudoalteromonas sp. SR45-6]